MLIVLMKYLHIYTYRLSFFVYIPVFLGHSAVFVKYWLTINKFGPTSKVRWSNNKYKVTYPAF